MTDKLTIWGRREERRGEHRPGNNSNNAEVEQKITKNGLTESGRRLAGICPQLELRMNTTVVVQWGPACHRHLQVQPGKQWQSNLLTFLGEISAF